jgi:hypothetical protein
LAELFKPKPPDPPDPPAETVPPGTPGSDSIPVTDAQTGSVQHGAPMIRLSAKAAARRDAASPAKMRSMALSTPTAGHAASGVMTVAPAPGRTAIDIDGQPYPLEGKVVPVSDAYAHRRLRDGSLVRINTEG